MVADLKPMQEYNRFWDVSKNGEVAFIQFKGGKSELWMMDSK
jgi:hypothetical protein